MKKVIVFSAIVVAVLSVSLVLMGAGTKSELINQVEREYEALETRVENMGTASAGEQTEIMKSYADLLRKIVNGDKSQKAEYAKLVRDITKNTVEFNDDDVFDVAKRMADYTQYVADGNDDVGVQGISIAADGTPMIDYIGVRGYSVRTMQSNDQEYAGEKMVDYDGSLGACRTEITFYDAKASDKFIGQYPLWQVNQIAGTNLKMKAVYNFSHGLVIYIGSDAPLNIVEKSFTNLTDRPMDSVNLTAAN